MARGMHPFSAEVWILFAGIGAFGVIAVLYGASCVLHHELSRVRLDRKARLVYEEYQLRIDTIARGEAEVSSSGEILTLPLGDGDARAAA